MNDFDKQNNDEQPVVSSQQDFPADTYPHKYVHSVFEDRQDAMQAVQALLAAGFTTDDIHFMESQHYVQAAQVGNQQQGGLTKSLLHFISSLDHGVNDAYMKEAQRGNDILSVRISRQDQIAQVRDILALHHGHLLKYVDTWTEANLSDSTTHGDW
jgi:hypothetical protein